MKLISEKLDHVAGMLAILTPETLACPTFGGALRVRLRTIADEAREMEARLPHPTVPATPTALLEPSA